MNLEIREANINDLERISKIEEICFPNAEAATKNSLEERIKAFKESFFVGEINNEVIGFINGAIIDSKTIFDELYENTNLHNPNGKYQSVFGLDVIPELRNQGIATRLMNHIIDVAKKSNREGIVLTCKDKLIHYYEKFGFKNMGVSESVHGNVTWYDMFLEL